MSMSSQDPRLLIPTYHPYASLLLIEHRKLLAKVLNFGRVIARDVGVVRMKGGVILMISLGVIELAQRNHLRDDRAGKRFRLFQLRYVSLGYVFLLIVGIENYRTILGTGIRPLTIELCGVEGHGEKYSKELPVGNLCRIERNLHRLGVAGLPCTHLLVGRRRDRTA